MEEIKKICERFKYDFDKTADYIWENKGFLMNSKVRNFAPEVLRKVSKKLKAANAINLKGNFPAEQSFKGEETGSKKLEWRRFSSKKALNTRRSEKGFNGLGRGEEGQRIFIETS